MKHPMHLSLELFQLANLGTATSQNGAPDWQHYGLEAVITTPAKFVARLCDIRLSQLGIAHLPYSQVPLGDVVRLPGLATSS